MSRNWDEYEFGRGYAAFREGESFYSMSGSSVARKAGWKFACDEQLNGKADLPAWKHPLEEKLGSLLHSKVERPMHWLTIPYLGTVIYFGAWEDLETFAGAVSVALLVLPLTVVIPALIQTWGVNNFAPQLYWLLRGRNIPIEKAPSVSERLAELDEMRSRELITEQEYEGKKNDLLERL